jgi:hypothetical protein
LTLTEKSRSINSINPFIPTEAVKAASSKLVLPMSAQPQHALCRKGISMSDNYYWEPTKTARVLAERGIALEEVQSVFEDEFLDIAPDLV